MKIGDSIMGRTDRQDQDVFLWETKLDRKFLSYHTANPHVYILFQKYARQMLNAGRKRYSARTIIHRIRWHADLQTSGDPFKMNNNYTSRYARKLMTDDPSFDGFFELRELKS